MLLRPEHTPAVLKRFRRLVTEEALNARITIRYVAACATPHIAAAIATTSFGWVLIWHSPLDYAVQGDWELSGDYAEIMKGL